MTHNSTPAELTKEAIQKRLHANNINRDNGIEIPEVWIPTIEKHSSGLVPQQMAEGTASNRNNRDRTTRLFPHVKIWLS